MRPNGVTTNYSYDSLSRLLSVLHQAGGTTIDGAGYTYDAVGNRTSKTNYLTGTTENYAYDPLYQLTQVTQGGSTAESYSYDPVGNRLSSVGVPLYNYNSSNELTSSSAGSYTYDANGNTRTDAEGRSFTWDFENRLTQVVNPGVGTTTFKYDPFGRRIQKFGPLGTTNYIYDEGSDIEEVDTTGGVLARYTQGRNVDEPLAQLRGGTTSDYQQDGLGSVTSLSNSGGTVAETYTYGSYGNRVASTGSLVNPFQYTGREFDSETGIYYYRARYFDPTQGRFLNEDGLRFGAGLNFYEYVQNNPLRWIDPSGNKKCFVVTYSGTTEVPCANECIKNDTVCNVSPVGPPPPLGPPPAWIFDTVLLQGMENCLSEEVEELSDLRTQQLNSIFTFEIGSGIKGIMAGGIESAFEHAGAKLPELLGPLADGGLFILDINEIRKQNEEFNQEMENIKQRECKCEQEIQDEVQRTIDRLSKETAAF